MKNLFKNKIALVVACVLLVSVIVVIAMAFLPGKVPIENPQETTENSDVNPETPVVSNPDDTSITINNESSEPPVPTDAVPDDGGIKVDELVVIGDPETDKTEEMPKVVDTSSEKTEDKKSDTEIIPTDGKTETGTKPNEDEQHDEPAKNEDEKFETPSDDKEKEVIVGDENKTTDNTSKGDAVADNTPDDNGYTPPTGGENPFAGGNTPVIDENPVDDYIDPVEGRPGEGVHF